MNTRKVEWVLVGLQFLLLALLLFPYSRSQDAGFRVADLCALILIVAGVFTGSLAVYQMRRHISALPTPRSDSELLDSGIYSFIRHPMYTAIITFGVGYAWWCNDFFKILIMFILLILFQWKSEMEELMLAKHFPGYRFYASHTGKFLPLLFTEKPTD